LENDEQPAKDSLVSDDPGGDPSDNRNGVPVVARSGRTVRAPQNPDMMYY